LNENQALQAQLAAAQANAASQEAVIASLNASMAFLANQGAQLTSQVNIMNSQISSLGSQVSSLSSQVSNLQSVVNLQVSDTIASNLAVSSVTDYFAGVFPVVANFTADDVGYVILSGRAANATAWVGCYSSGPSCGSTGISALLYDAYGPLSGSFSISILVPQGRVVILFYDPMGYGSDTVNVTYYY
jgi:uncharacterized coiled-coil protein SlyX